MTANLLSRLQGLTAPDREVDGLIEIRFGLMPEDAVFARENVFGREVNQWHTGGFGSYQFHYPEEYTASIDAAVALCERVLPGWSWCAIKRPDTGIGYVHNNESVYTGIAATPNPKRRWHEFRHESPAIALLIAILTALEARDGS